MGYIKVHHSTLAAARRALDKQVLKVYGDEADDVGFADDILTHESLTWRMEHKGLARTMEYNFKTKKITDASWRGRLS